MDVRKHVGEVDARKLETQILLGQEQKEEWKKTSRHNSLKFNT